MISTTGALGIGAIVAAIAAGWGTVKSYLMQLYGLFFKVSVLNQNLTSDLGRYIKINNIKVYTTSIRFFTEFSHIRNSKEASWILCKTFFSDLGDKDSSNLFFVGKVPIFLKLNNEGMSFNCKLTTFRFFDIDTFINKVLVDAQNSFRVLDASNRESEKPYNFSVRKISGTRFFKSSSVSESAKPGITGQSSEVSFYFENRNIFGKCINYDDKDLCLPPPTYYIENLWLDDNIKQVFNEVETFFNHSKWFYDRGLPHKRSYLFYGKPGNGKSKFAYSLAQKLGKPLFIFDLASMDNKSFPEQLGLYAVQSGCIVLFEDIDSIFEGRTNKTATDLDLGLTFDCFINALDGANIDGDGRVIIMTTNDISKLDPAIAGFTNTNHGSSTRPGRVDRIVEFNDLPKEGRLFIANRIFKDIDKTLWLPLVEESEGMSGAQFQEKCFRFAYDYFWKEVGNVK